MRSIVHPAVFVAALLFTLSGLSDPAAAQDVRALLNRIDTLERDLNTLQRQVYRGGAPSTVITSPAIQGGGEAAGLPANVAARIEVRLTQLENELRAVTGQAEEARHAARVMTERFDKLAADIDFRLTEMERRLAGPAGVAQPGEAPPAGAAQAPAVAQPAPAPQPGVLGTMPQREVERLAQPPAAAAPAGTAQPQPQPPAVAAAPATPQEQYKQAFGLLQQSDYAGAEKALKGFLDQHAGDPLAGNAQYWLGETHYVRNDFQQAAVAFLQGYQKYPKGNKAPDSLLKLGLSLSQLGQTREACAALGRLATEFPNAADSVKGRASAERQKLGCP